MTKLAILSDIHGNLPALEAVISDLEIFEVDHVIVPGDVTNFGPFSRQTAELVIEKGWSVIRGNNEFFLVDYKTPRAPAEWNDPIQVAPTVWLDRQFDQRLKTIIASWADTLNLRFRDARRSRFFMARRTARGIRSIGRCQMKRSRKYFPMWKQITSFVATLIYQWIVKQAGGVFSIPVRWEFPLTGYSRQVT
jgi:3',5'-cyclic AMP phosphodiesterase CpdA